MLKKRYLLLPFVTFFLMSCVTDYEYTTRARDVRLASQRMGAVKQSSSEVFTTGQEKSNHKKGVYHTVKTGETLYSIAKTYGVDAEVIAEYNRLPDSSVIERDQMLYIP